MAGTSAALRQLQDDDDGGCSFIHQRLIIIQHRTFGVCVSQFMDEDKMLIDNLKDSLSVHELQAHRALAMAERFLRAKVPKEFAIKRASTFARTLKILSKNEAISDETVDKILSVSKKCKELKRSLSSSPITPPSSSMKSNKAENSIASKTVQDTLNTAPSRETNEASIDHIQNLLIEQKVRRDIGFVLLIRLEMNFLAHLFRKCNRRNYLLRGKIKKLLLQSLPV